MDLEKFQCLSCGHLAEPSPEKPSSCQHCHSSELARVVRCAWCIQWSRDEEFCSHCGTVIARGDRFGIARILKKQGVNQASVNLEAEKLPPEQQQQLSESFQQHAKVADALIEHAHFCSQYLFDPSSAARVEDSILKELPFSEEDLEYFQSGLLAPDPNPATRLASVATGCKIDELAELALIALIRIPDAIIDAEHARSWLESTTQIAFGDGANAVEALVALAHWRTLVAPFYISCYEGDLGRKIYNNAYGKLFNSEGDLAVWMAVLCARTEYYQKLEADDKNRQKFVETLKYGLQSASDDLRLACAALLQDEAVLAKYLEADADDVRAFVLYMLTQTGSEQLADIIPDADDHVLSQIIDGLVADQEKSLSDRYAGALVRVLDRLKPDMIEQVLALFTRDPAISAKYFPQISTYLSRHKNKDLAIRLLSQGDAGRNPEIQKLLAQNSFNPAWMPELLKLAESQYLIPALADTVVRYMRKVMQSGEFSQHQKEFTTLIYSQVQQQNRAAFIFLRFIMDSLFGRNTELSNNTFRMLGSDIDLFVDAVAQTDSSIVFLNEAFCNLYFGSADSFLSLLTGMLQNSDDYAASAWVLEQCFARQSVLKKLLAQYPVYTRPFIDIMGKVYLADEAVRDRVRHFLFDEVEGRDSPFFDSIGIDDFDQGLLAVLADASAEYSFTKPLLIESLQYLEMHQSPEFLDQIKTILTNQSHLMPAYAYYCFAYLMRNCFSAENPELANKAYNILNYLSSRGITYLSPRDNSQLRINDLSNLIRNFFVNLKDFTTQLIRLISSKQIYGIELWLASGFQRNASLVRTLYHDQPEFFHSLLLAVTVSLANGKYSKNSQGMMMDMLREFIPDLRISQTIKTSVLKELSGVEVGAEMPAGIAGHLRLLIQELEKTGASVDMEMQAGVGQVARSEDRAVLSQVNFGAPASEVDFEVSLSWLHRFCQVSRDQGLARLMPWLGLFHNYSQEFKAILANEPSSRAALLDKLIDLMFDDTPEDDDCLSQKLLISELIFSLANNSRFAHYGITRIQEKLQSSEAGERATHYVKRILQNLSDTRMSDGPGDSNPEDMVTPESSIPTARRFPMVGVSELGFNTRGIANELKTDAARKYIEEGVAWATAGDLMAAINSFKAALDVEDSHHIHYLIGKAYLLYDLPDQASRHLQQCLVRNPENWQALLLYAYQQEYVVRDTKFALELAERAHALQPDSDRVLVRLASVNIKLGQNAAAMKLIQQAIKANPENAEVYFLLGEILRTNKRFKESILNYQKALALGGKDSIVFSSLGLSHFHAGNIVEAVKNFKIALNQFGACANAHHGLGQVYMSTGDNLGARDHLQKACQLNPGNRQYKIELAEFYESVGEDEQALGLLQQSVDQNNPDPSLLIQIAGVCSKQNRIADARKYLERAIALQPENFQLYYDLACLYLQTEEPGNAVGVLNRAIELKPDYIDAWLKAGEVYFDMRRPDEARRCFENVLNIDEHQSDALMALGNIYKKAGDKARAKRFFERARQN